MKIKYPIIIIFLLALSTVLLFPFFGTLVLMDGNNKTLCTFNWPSNELTVGWRHSVELTPWEETYQITKDNELSFVETVYQSYGAGTPDTDGKVEFLEDGYIRVTDIPRTMEYFSLYYVSISNYYIKSDKEIYYLEDYIEEFTPVNIIHKKSSLFEMIVNKIKIYRE